MAVCDQLVCCKYALYIMLTKMGNLPYRCHSRTAQPLTDRSSFATFTCSTSDQPFKSVLCDVTKRSMPSLFGIPPFLSPFPGLSRAAVRLRWNVWLPQPAPAVPRRAAAALRPLAIVPLQSAAPHGPVLLRIAQPGTVSSWSRPAQPPAVL